MSALVPCRDCNRHVRAGAACPFCGAATIATPTTSIGRSSRAALLAIAATAAACDQPSHVSMYGAPPAPATVDTARADAAPTASVMPPTPSDTVQATVYGGPPAPSTSAPKVVPKP